MSTFLVQGQSPRTSSFVHPTQGDAALHALAMLGPRQSHVTVEGKTGQTATFGVRHFRWTPAEGITDSEWRCWIDGRYVGVRAKFDLDELVTT